MIRFSPHPPRKSFCISFVDDTDYSTIENTKPVYDLLTHSGLWGTKTVWPLRAKRNSAFRRDLEADTPVPNTGSTLEDPDYRSFIRDLQSAGFEIALHGVAAGNSTREEILDGLDYFSRALGRPPAMNVFHQTNIDNLYCGAQKLDSPWFRAIERATDRSEYEGHRPGSPSFWGDIVRDTFRYVRLPFHTIDEVNTLRVNPSMPFHDPRRPFVSHWFASSDGADVLRFNRLLSEANVERLADQQGVCIVYTHFASLFARRGPNGYALDQEFVRTVKRVTRDPRAWFSTTTKLLDRLRSVRALSLRHEGRRLEIAHSGDRSVEGVVMLMPPDMRVESVDAAPIEHGQGFAVLPTIHPGSTIVLTTNREGRQFLKPSDSIVDRAERRRIERRNYLGLIRGALRDRLYHSALSSPVAAIAGQILCEIGPP